MTTQRTVQVLSSKGDKHYPVTLEDGKAVACCDDCPAWFHNKKCRHLGRAEELDREEQAREQGGQA